MRHNALFSLPLLCLLLVLTAVCASSCRYAPPDLTSAQLSPRAKDSLALWYTHHYTWGANFELIADSSVLERLPVKGERFTLHRGDRVVVAEFAVHPSDSVDSVWVKLAHSQEAQGWLRESELKRSFVPTDSISHAIHLFRTTHVAYFIIVFALFIVVCLYRFIRRKPLYLLWLNDIDSAYPLLLCFLTAFCATLYESMQQFAPELWEHFYYNPTLSPFDVPLLLSVFLAGIWLFVAVFLAMLDDLFRQLPPFAAICYLLGLVACCIVCYVLFILTTSLYVGYLLLCLLLYLLWHRFRRNLRYRYRCGNCGAKLTDKGICPVCGAENR